MLKLGKIGKNICNFAENFVKNTRFCLYLLGLKSRVDRRKNSLVIVCV